MSVSGIFLTHEFYSFMRAAGTTTQMPIPLADLKRHLNLDSNEDDALLEEYQKAAIDRVEKHLNKPLYASTCNATFQLKYNNYNEIRGVLLRGPVISITNLTATENGVPIPLHADTDYTLNLDGPLLDGYVDLITSIYKYDRLLVTYESGFLSSRVNTFDLLQAIRLMVSGYYEHREDISPANYQMNPAARALLTSYRTL